MNFKEHIKNRFILMDGAMGTMLQRAGMKAGEIPDILNVKNPEIIESIHKEYVEAGSDVITTNTFSSNRLKLNGTDFSVEEIVTRAVEIAKRIAGKSLVALDIGPVGQLMEPMGTLSFEEAYELFEEQVKAAVMAGVDLILIETMADIYEAKAAILAAKENSCLPVLCTLTFSADGRTLMGTDPLTAVTVLESLGVDALGINCSLGPKDVMPIVDEMLKYSKVPLMVQPNAGLPKLIDGKTVFDMSPQEFTRYIKQMAEKGVRIFGGCCGTDPEFIREVKKSLQGLQPHNTTPVILTTVSSGTKTVTIGDSVTIIGERINPTGKKLLKEALKTGDMDYILSEAISQKDSGAHILDVNVGLPGIDESTTMKQVVREIQGLVNLPLQIDSSEPDVIEAAVRIYNGKPLINSVNGKKSSMEAILPIAKKYGACVLGLTLDEEGIPPNAAGRVKIAEKIIKGAEEYGIPRENILIDCLVLTASAQQEEVMETIKAIRQVKEKLGVKTVLGVSNVSFGLPGRETINRTFLAMALNSGLDAPILNPMSSDMMDTVMAYNVLSNKDREASIYISRVTKREVNAESKAKQDDKKDLIQCILDGMEEAAASHTRKLLEIREPLDIVNNYLVPALDEAGRRYEKGDIFLPQLIRCAETVKAAFGVIKGKLNESSADDSQRGKIVLATVKGDIHDIGKNIVKVLLENYGYNILDLGKDVPPERVVEVVRNQNVKMVGLSALMTTTVKSMEDTIRLLKKEVPACRVVVGGAVLNEDYAKIIGADYFARDAREGVRIAGEIFED